MADLGEIDKEVLEQFVLTVRLQHKKKVREICDRPLEIVIHLQADSTNHKAR